MRLIDADAYIENNECFGYLDEISVKRFNEITPTVDAVPWMWLEAFAKAKPFDSVDEFIAEAKEMNRKMYWCCCADGERRE